MKVKSLHLYRRGFNNPKDKLCADATIEVPGIGEIKFEHALTDETIARIEAESVAALQVRFGNKVSEKPPLT